MISHSLTERPQQPWRRSTRRGGPHLFRTVWPEVRATLAEAAGLPRVEPQGGQGAGAELPRPPWSRAA